MSELERFIANYNNSYLNTDNAYGAQCWDLFDKFCQDYNINVSRYCAITGYVPDLFYLFDEYGYSEYFEKINVENLQAGDWCFWDYGNMRHVALKVGSNTYFSQNPNPSQVITLSPVGLIGGLRPKLTNWTTEESKPASMEETNVYMLACDVLNGRYGNGEERINRLGNVYNAVQEKVNEYYNDTDLFISNVADCVIRGDFGNGEERMERLGSIYQEVQNEVNSRY
jgi:hypothetical protein